MGSPRPPLLHKCATKSVDENLRLLNELQWSAGGLPGLVRRESFRHQDHIMPRNTSRKERSPPGMSAEACSKGGGRTF